MRVSPAGRAAIRQREGCRLVAYRDSRGIPTIGVGHVDMTPPVTRMGMTITLEQADAMLAADLGPVEEAIARFVLVPLSQNQCDALASLAFNIGLGSPMKHGFRQSTVVSRLNRGDYRGAADAFMLWSKPAVLAGRRRAEMAQFRTPDAPQAAVLETKSAPAQAPKPAAPATTTPLPAVPAAPPPSPLSRIASLFG